MDEATGTLVDPIPGTPDNRLTDADAGRFGCADLEQAFGEQAVGEQAFDEQAFGVLAARWVWEADREALASGAVPITPVVAAKWALDDAVVAQRQLNQALAGQLGALAELFQTARTHPEMYLSSAGMHAVDAVELAERSAALDAGLQLHLSPNQVRNQAHEGQVLADSLPRLWALFRAGDTGYAQAAAAVHALTGLTDPAAIEHYDTELASQAGEATPEAFRQTARRLADRLRAEPPELRHALGLVDRRVVVEPAPDGMAWIHAYLSAPHAMLIKRRLDQTAKNITATQAHTARSAGTGPVRCRQTRDQIRADLFAAWLTGAGTPTAAKVRVLLFVPLLGLLNGTSTAGTGTNRPARTGQAGRPILTGQSSVLDGYGPIDLVSAAQLFTDAPSFRRVGTDPFTGEILTFDRGRYRPTTAQHEYLAMKYGACGTPGCERLAVTSDLDHLKEWAKDHGLTNENNLIPLCAPDHRLKTLTKIRYTREPDGTINVTTPTGTTARKTPKKPLPDNPPF